MRTVHTNMHIYVCHSYFSNDVFFIIHSLSLVCLWHALHSMPYILCRTLVYFVPDKHEKRPTSSKLTVNRCKTLIHIKCNKVQQNECVCVHLLFMFYALFTFMRV